MRDIKFRVWDKEEKRMINSDEPIWKDEWEGNTYLKLSMDGLLCTAYWNKQKYDYYKDKFELMQYTGLKDKNGKEIYQDDILSIDGVNVKVEWYNGAWTVEYFISPKRSYLSTFDETDVEVIGNIYEDGELLEDKP